MNPSVIDAFALVIVADGQGPAYPGQPNDGVNLKGAREDAREIGLAMAELRKIVPNAGSYVSESNYFNNSWRNAFWGRNYSRLRAIKRSYDPDGLFFVHHGVGSEDWSSDGFIRLV
jgi:FAD/FMN-containing dehydrogenase